MNPMRSNPRAVAAAGAAGTALVVAAVLVVGFGTGPSGRAESHLRIYTGTPTVSSTTIVDTTTIPTTVPPVTTAPAATTTVDAPTARVQRNDGITPEPVATTVAPAPQQQPVGPPPTTTPPTTAPPSYAYTMSATCDSRTVSVTLTPDPGARTTNGELDISWASPWTDVQHVNRYPDNGTYPIGEPSNVAAGQTAEVFFTPDNVGPQSVYVTTC